MSTPTKDPWWERGWRVHGYWDAGEDGDLQVGRVCRPPGRSMFGQVYSWEYYFSEGELSGQAPTLEQAKRRVEALHRRHRRSTLRHLQKKKKAWS